MKLKYVVKVEIPDNIDPETILDSDAQHFGQFHLDSGRMKPDDPFYNSEFNIASVEFDEVEADYDD